MSFRKCMHIHNFDCNYVKTREASNAYGWQYQDLKTSGPEPKYRSEPRCGGLQSPMWAIS
jgi:hypothetical protein